MKIKYQTCDVQRSETTVIRITVPAWEVPLLQALHGLVAVNVLGDQLFDGELPDASAEFERLESRYGRDRRDDGSLGMPYAQAVFGQFAPGVMNLRRSMEAATV